MSPVMALTLALVFIWLLRTGNLVKLVDALRVALEV